MIIDFSAGSVHVLASDPVPGVVSRIAANLVNKHRSPIYVFFSGTEYDLRLQPLLRGKTEELVACVLRVQYEKRAICYEVKCEDCNVTSAFDQEPNERTPCPLCGGKLAPTLRYTDRNPNDPGNDGNND